LFFFSPGAPRVFGIGIAVGSDIFDFGSHYVGEAVDAAVELMHRAGSAAGEQLFVALVFISGLFFFVAVFCF
jgi:small basic protein